MNMGSKSYQLRTGGAFSAAAPELDEMERTLMNAISMQRDLRKLEDYQALLSRLSLAVSNRQHAIFSTMEVEARQMNVEIQQLRRERTAQAGGLKKVA